MTAAEIYKNAGMFFPPPPLPHLSAEEIASATESSGVYFLYEGHRLVYVGESINVRQRLSNHGHRGRFDCVGILACDSQHRKRLESFYIGLLDPPLNQQSTSSCATSNARIRIARAKCNSLSELMRRLLRYVEANPGCSKTDLHKHVGWRRGAHEVNVLLDRMREWRLITAMAVRTAGRSKNLFYAASHKAEAVA